MDLVFSVRRKKGSMERVVDFPRFGEAELIRNGRKDFDDCEWSFSFWGELRVGNGPFEVSCLKPDFVAFGKGSESLVIT